MSNWFAWPPWGSLRGRQYIPDPDLNRPLSRNRSSPRRGRRRSSDLTPAQKSAKAREEKRAKEIEDERVASMSPAARAAYKERKRLREEQRIKDIKATFAKDLRYVADQFQTQAEQTSSEWKRKHDDDSAAQAAERRQAFIDARAARAREALRLERTVNIEREAIKSHAVELLEGVYKDLQRHSIHPTMINSETYDPYTILRHRQYTSSQRFVRLASSPEDGEGGIGIDSAAVLMMSEHFRSALQYGENDDGSEAEDGEAAFPFVALWEGFKIKLLLEHTSIRGFAIARHIPYNTVYRRSGRDVIGLDTDESLQLSPSIRDPFEVYLTSDGRLLPLLFTPLPGNLDPAHQGVVPLPFQNLKENVYIKENFKGYAPPSSWPPDWEYPPADMQHPCRVWGKNYPVCVACGLRTGPLELPEEPEGPEEPEAPERIRICQCKTAKLFDEILIEAREFQSGTTSKQLDLGIRSLMKIHKGHIIGEFLGEFVPLGAEVDFHCPPLFAIDFNGPPAVDKDGKVLEFDTDVIRKKPIDTNTDPIATLITGHKGGWTRLINSGTSQTANVEARSEVWAGRLRITVRALRDIKFGEQLLIRYGDIYLEPDGQSLNARKKDHNERLPMRALSGFFK